MRVGIVAQPWGSVLRADNTGSLSVWCHEVASRLARSCEALVLAPRQRGLKSLECHRGVRYRRLAMEPDRFLLRLARRALRSNDAHRPLFAHGLFHAVYALQVAMALREHRCDVAHIHNLAQFVPIIRALNGDIRIVLHMHCEWLTQLDRGITARRLKGVDTIIGCSQYLSDKIRARFPEYADRCRTVFNAVDPSRFAAGGHAPGSSNGRGRRLLFVGRVSPEKGLHLLLDALAKVVRRYPDAHLDIVGEIGAIPKDFIVSLSDDDRVRRLAPFYEGKDYAAHLADRMAARGLRDHVTFHGPLPHAKTAEFYRNADALVHPSLSEAFGMTLVEAMATGIPVIAWRLGGMVEVIDDGKTGFLIEPEDTDALAEAVCRVLSAGDEARAMGQAGRERARELFTWDRHVEGLLRLYEKACDDGQSSRA